MSLEEAVQVIRVWADNCQYAAQNTDNPKEERSEWLEKGEAYLSVLSLLKEVREKKHDS